MKALKKTIDGLTVAEMIICAVFFALMVICYFISVVNRNFIKASMPWTEEIALYSMVYMALLGTEVGLRGTQVSVTAVTDKLKGTLAGKILDYIARIALIVFVFIIFRQGLALVTKQFATGQTTPVLKIPMYLMYFSLVLSFGITLITQVLIIICKIFRLPVDEFTEVDSLVDRVFGDKKKKEGEE